MTNKPFTTFTTSSNAPSLDCHPSFSNESSLELFRPFIKIKILWIGMKEKYIKVPPKEISFPSIGNFFSGTSRLRKFFKPNWILKFSDTDVTKRFQALDIFRVSQIQLGSNFHKILISFFTVSPSLASLTSVFQRSRPTRSEIASWCTASHLPGLRVEMPLICKCENVPSEKPKRMSL